MPDAGRGAGAGLERALGRWDLTAIGVNQVIGTAIFLMPSEVAARVGNWGPVAFLLTGLVVLCVALCFAEVGSRFDRTGGPYLYARAAFGRFVGFEVGWMAWFTRATSQAAVVNGLTLALGFYWPALAAGAGRAGVITALTLWLGWVTLRGIRQSARLVDTLTVAKLLPLGVLIAVGLALADFSRLTPIPAITATQAGAAGLLLVFVFGGFEVVGVPAGESRDPRRDVPFALIVTVLLVTTVFTLAHVVAATALPDLARSRTPLADAAQALMGPGGALLIGVGSMLAMLGNLAGQVLAGSRFLFALAEQGDLPRWLGRVHPRFHTPSNAVIGTTAVALSLALAGSFAALATAAAMARLLVYACTCGATLVFRDQARAARAGVGAATFTAPLGPLVPAVGVLVSVGLVFGATRQQIVGGLAFLAVGALLFAAARWGPRHREG